MVIQSTTELSLFYCTHSGDWRRLFVSVLLLYTNKMNSQFSLVFIVSIDVSITTDEREEKFNREK